MAQDTTVLQTVSRAVAVLRCFEGGAVDLSLAELAARMQLNKVTVLRLARTLAKEGLLIHDTRTGLYRMSFGCIGLARKLLDRDGLFECAQPFMEEARSRTRETVCLIVREELDRVTTHSLPSMQPVRFVLEVGDRRPVHLGAAGQCLLSALPDDQLDAVLRRIDERPAAERETAGGRTVSGAEVRERVDRVRRQGWAIGRQEWSSEAAGAAAPIVSPDGSVKGAISIVMPISRATDAYMEQCAAAAREAAEKTSAELRRQHQ